MDTAERNPQEPVNISIQRTSTYTANFFLLNSCTLFELANRHLIIRGLAPRLQRGHHVCEHLLQYKPDSLNFVQVLNTINMSQQAEEQALYREVTREIDCMEIELCPMCSQEVEEKVAKILARSRMDRPPSYEEAVAQKQGAENAAASSLDTFQFEFVNHMPAFGESDRELTQMSIQRMMLPNLKPEKIEGKSESLSVSRRAERKGFNRNFARRPARMASPAGLLVAEEPTEEEKPMRVVRQDGREFVDTERFTPLGHRVYYEEEEEMVEFFVETREGKIVKPWFLFSFFYESLDSKGRFL